MIWDPTASMETSIDSGSKGLRPQTRYQTDVPGSASSDRQEGINGPSTSQTWASAFLRLGCGPSHLEPQRLTCSPYVILLTHIFETSTNVYTSVVTTSPTSNDMPSISWKLGEWWHYYYSPWTQPPPCEGRTWTPRVTTDNTTPYYLTLDWLLCSHWLLASGRHWTCVAPGLWISLHQNLWELRSK